jgi:tRNA dimethylallyltransferase
MTRRPPLALVGPTASGKTAASMPIAEALNAEIVSIDANLAYRGMDVWVGKPTAEQRRRVRHHLIDLVDPVTPVGVAIFQRLAREALGDIHRRGCSALLVGGSGLYYRAVLDDLEFPETEAVTRALLEAEAAAAGPEALYERLAALDPVAAERIHPMNARRTVRALEVAAITGRPFSSFYRGWSRYSPEAVVAGGIDLPPTALHRRIEDRVARQLRGLLEETRGLLERGFGPFLTSFHVIGYAEAVACLEGKIGQEEAAARIAKRDKALARRQLSWFRRDPRIRWFPAGEEGAIGLVDELVAFFRARGRTPAAADAMEA